MNPTKNQATYFLNFGSQIRTPPAICNTPKNFQSGREILFIKEQGGSKKLKNLSAPIIKNERLQMAVSMFEIFILKDTRIN